MRVHTRRLELVPATAEHVRWEINNHAQLGQALAATIPQSWPPESTRDALDFFARMLEGSPDRQGWMSYYWISRAEDLGPRVLIGGGGFMGRPDAEGVVEVGYSVLPEFQNQGYATEAVQALAAWALSQPGVAQVVAEASPDNAASVRILTKCGFVSIGNASAPELSRFEFRPPS